MPEIISVFLVFSSTESSFGTHKERGTTLLAPRKLLELIRRNDRAGTTHCRHGLADLHAFSETEIWTNAEANVAGTRVAVEGAAGAKRICVREIRLSGSEQRRILRFEGQKGLLHLCARACAEKLGRATGRERGCQFV